MPFATVCWEISTGDPVRYASIASAVQSALGNFGPSPLLATTAILETETQNIEIVRRALDAVASSFPQEFFYTSSNHGSADVQGVYPPWGALAGAHAATGSSRNPKARTVTPVHVAAGPPGQRRTGARRTGRRGRPARARAGKGRSRRRTAARKPSPKTGRKPRAKAARKSPSKRSARRGRTKRAGRRRRQKRSTP